MEWRGSLSEPAGRCLQSLSVLSLIDNLMAGAAHAQVTLRATESVIESAGGRLRRLRVEPAAYHQRWRLDTAGQIGRPSNRAERRRPSNARRSPAFAESVLGNRRVPQHLANRLIDLMRTIPGVDLRIPVGEEITLVRHVGRIARHGRHGRKPRR